jgi:hypothetical protein
MFLDFAEDQARRRKQIFLSTWQSRLEDFLRLNERPILRDAGKISREQAEAHAEEEYEQFAARRRTALEAEAEADAFRQLEAEIEKLPKPKAAKSSRSKKS